MKDSHSVFLRRLSKDYKICRDFKFVYIKEWDELDPSVIISFEKPSDGKYGQGHLAIQ